MSGVLTNWLSGRWRLQKVFDRLHQFLLAGMGYGVPLSAAEGGERSVIDRVLQRSRNTPCPILFDVGANVGHYAQLLREALGPKGRIYCFEPAGATFRQLQANVKELPGVITHNCGLSDKTGQSELFSAEGRSALSSVYRRNLEFCDIAMNQTEAIQLVTLDDFCESNAIERIDFLKIDVEGHEYSVLRGAERMLRERRISFIQFEFGGCNIDSRTFFRDFWYLLNKDYQMYRIVKGGLVPMVSYGEHLEIFMYVNFLAELRAP